MSFARGLQSGFSIGTQLGNIYQDRKYTEALADYEKELADMQAANENPTPSSPAANPPQMPAGLAPQAPQVPSSAGPVDPLAQFTATGSQAAPARGLAQVEAPSMPSQLEQMRRRRAIAAEYGRKGELARYDQGITGLEAQEAEAARWQQQFAEQQRQFGITNDRLNAQLEETTQNNIRIQSRLDEQLKFAQDQYQDKQTLKLAETSAVTAARDVAAGVANYNTLKQKYVEQFGDDPVALATFENAFDKAFLDDVGITSAQYGSMYQRGTAGLLNLSQIPVDSEFDAEGNDLALGQINQLIGDNFDSDITDNVEVKAIRNPETGKIEVYEGDMLLFEGSASEIANTALAQIQENPQAFVARSIQNEQIRVRRAEKEYQAFLDAQDIDMERRKLVSDQLKELMKQPTYLTMDEAERNAMIADVFQLNGVAVPESLGISTQAEDGGKTENGGEETTVDPVSQLVADREEAVASEGAKTRDYINSVTKYRGYLRSGDITPADLELLLRDPATTPETARAITTALDMYKSGEGDSLLRQGF